MKDSDLQKLETKVDGWLATVAMVYKDTDPEQALEELASSEAECTALVLRLIPMIRGSTNQNTKEACTLVARTVAMLRLYELSRHKHNGKASV